MMVDLYNLIGRLVVDYGISSSEAFLLGKSFRELNSRFGTDSVTIRTRCNLSKSRTSEIIRTLRVKNIIVRRPINGRMEKYSWRLNEEHDAFKLSSVASHSIAPTEPNGTKLGYW